MKTFLEIILEDVRDEVSSAKLQRTPRDIRAMLADAPPIRHLAANLGSGFGIIAEIKQRSPSVGPMRTENVREATSAYAESPIVRAVSVLTNERHFGMNITALSQVREIVLQPILRKDFILDEYQVREARAFGADAVLLMASVLDASRLKGYHELAQELGMEVLFEVHTEAEISMLPSSAQIIGINSRKFKSHSGFVGVEGSSEKDFSLDLKTFDLVNKLQPGMLKVAESGMTPSLLSQIRPSFHAALIGTSLLRDPRGVRACLQEFEQAIAHRE